jgi:MFS family permease
MPARRIVGMGFSIIALGIGGSFIGLDRDMPSAALIVAWAVAGLGMGLSYQAVTLAVLADATPGEEGKASAAQQLADLLGVATGAGVVGAVVAIGHTRAWSTATSLRIGYAITLAVAIIGFVISRRLSVTARQPTLGGHTA